MLSSVTFGKYMIGNLELHKLNPVCKILSLVLMLFICFFINSYIDVIILSLCLILGILYSDVDIIIYVRELAIINWLLFTILIVDILSLSSISMILSDVFRIVFIFVYFSLIMKSTSMNDILYGILRILKPFNIKKDNMIGLNVFLIFKFPCTFLKNKERYYRIEEERYVKESKNIKTKFIKYKNDIMHIYNLSIRDLNDDMNNLKIRLYGYGKTRTDNNLDKLRSKDYIFIGLNIALLFIVIFY